MTNQKDYPKNSYKENIRYTAVKLLIRVEQEQAYSNLLLARYSDELQDSRNRQLLTSIVNGVLKHKLTLDYILRRFLSKPMSALPQSIRTVLRVGAFQILFLDKIPSPVAVHEAVELAKRFDSKYSSLVNSVLRKTAENGWEVVWPDPKREPVRYLSVRYSHPEWMVKRWLKRWGLEETEALCRINNEPAPTWIRTNTLKTSRDSLTKKLIEEGVEVEVGKRIPESILIRNFGNITELKSFREGLFTVQDESSQLVSHILNPLPGETVLDSCSAPGGKTTHLAQIMNNQGHILAFDIHEHKLTLIGENARRLGVEVIKPCLGDATELTGIEPESVDKALVDAPCSGLGIIRRKADLRWQKDEAGITQFPALQLKILEKASEMIKPGGELVYSTCTIEPEENFEVVKSFRQAHPEFETIDLLDILPFQLTDPKDIRQAKKGMLQLLPHHHGTDGFFIAKFLRK